MPSTRSLRLTWLLALFLGPALTSQAYWTKQVITLHPDVNGGWNAVWLEVDPPDNANSIQTVLKSVPEVKKVLRFVPGTSEWLTWEPNSPTTTNLHTIDGGVGYLIQIDPSHVGDVSWTVYGQPVVEKLSWLSTEHSFTGLPVDPAENVTFADFLAGSPAHLNPQIHQYKPDGSRELISTSTKIQRGVAYYISSCGASNFQGQGWVDVQNKGLLDFGSSVNVLSFTLYNDSGTQGNFTIEPLDASPPPSVLNAGAVRLAIWSPVTGKWEPFDSARTVTVDAHSNKELRLRIRRLEMLGKGKNFPFVRLLRVSGLKMSTVIGVRANGYDQNPSPAGLWVGHCVVTQVSQPPDPVPQDTASEASFRILLLVDKDRNAKLIREAYIFSRNGNYVVAVSDDDVDSLVGGNETKRVNYGQDNLDKNPLQGVAVRDNANVPRRISTVGYAFGDGVASVSMAPITSTGTFFSGGLQAQWTIGKNAKLNPFRHAYHPDHGQGLEITREMTLTFDMANPPDPEPEGWGVTEAGGGYQETITGPVNSYYVPDQTKPDERVLRNTVHAAGTFSITRVVDLSQATN